MTEIEKLLDIMARLRDPQRGCPWDLEQDFRSIAPYTLEEAAEVADAIEREAWDELPGELGDLLFQVVFYAQMARERGWFDFEAVARSINDKMVRRHPHVFADEARGTASEQTARWEAIKADERASAGTAHSSAVDGVPATLGALARAAKLGERAAKAGFDWRDLAGVRAKVTEELAELDAALEADDTAAIGEELGDLLFSVAQLARHARIDAAQALRASSIKFERRFRALERAAGAPERPLAALSDAALERLWQRIKQAD